jgi:pimeloyl-ACP methyl ester carboxylesterase
MIKSVKGCVRGRFRVFSSLALALLAVACGGYDDASGAAVAADLEGESFVLVHGSWNAAWVWKDVATELEARGAQVTRVELAAHGDDQTALSEASLATYVGQVTAALDVASSPVVLVGHSFGGTVISQTAEQNPDKLDRLIYLGAFVPADGESTLDLAQTDADSTLGPLLQVDMEHGLIGVDRSSFATTFCNDCNDSGLAALNENYRDEPLLPLVQKVSLSAEAFGSVAKYYVHTSADVVISHALQERMTARVALAGTATLKTSHSPFLSAPTELASTLGALSKP